MSAQKMSSGSKDCVELNKKDILDSINANEKYEEEGVLIRRWEGENHNYYTSHINKNGIKFLGILNGKLQKDGYGKTHYANGEDYFGFFEKDLRNKHGLYHWPAKNENGKRYTEYYWGYWRDNAKDNHGVYLWLKENEKNKPFSGFEKVDFEAYVGDISMDFYVKGCYLIKESDNYYLYYGNFDSAGRKTGKECFYYNSMHDKLLYGKMEKDAFISGYTAEFNEEGELNNLVYTEFDEKGKLSSFIERNDIDKNTRETIEAKMNKFRNIILEEDYFGEIYNKFKEVVEFAKVKLNSIDMLDSNEEFSNIVKKAVEYNDISIYKNIKKKL